MIASAIKENNFHLARLKEHRTQLATQIIGLHNYAATKQYQ